MKDYQDLRKIGRASRNLPRLAAICLIRNLSLCGFPFLSGFYSKDLILERFTTSGPGLALFILCLLATALTVIYRVRFTLGVFRLFRGRETFSIEADVNKTILGGIGLLIIPAVIGGW